jgi:hypothetical protein
MGRYKLNALQQITSRSHLHEASWKRKKEENLRRRKKMKRMIISGYRKKRSRKWSIEEWTKKNKQKQCKIHKTNSKTEERHHYHQFPWTPGRFQFFFFFGISANAADSIKLGGDVVFHSRSNAKEVHFIHYKFTFRMYTRTGYKRRNIREEYRRNQEEYTIHQHHQINNKEELHQQQAGNTDNGSSTRGGHRGKKGKKDQEEERPRP